MLILLVILFTCCCPVLSEATQYGIARSTAPVLNTSAFRSVFGGSDGKTLKKDRCGQVRELEFIALPGTVFTIIAELIDNATVVFQVETEDYPMPAGAKLYVDSRFIERCREKPVPRIRKLPTATEIINSLKGSVGSPYVWGGNVKNGVPELIGLFYNGDAPISLRRQQKLSGLDCSGMLYQATDGWTPRNTSLLVSYGKAVQISGKKLDEIAMMLEPLDLIVWNGHVIVVLDRDTVIESRLVCEKQGNDGVITTSLRQRLAEIIRIRQPVNQWPSVGKKPDAFVVRRWFVP